MTIVPKRQLRLGRGQVTMGDAGTWEARRAFLRAVYCVSPDTYWSLFPGESNDAAYQAWQERWGDDPEVMILDWQKCWHLRDPWLADVARDTLRVRLKWYVQGVTHVMGEDWFVTPRFRNTGTLSLIGFPLNELYWDRGTETRKYVRDRLISLLHAELDRVEAETSVPKTRTKSPEHFGWLARYQVLEESKEQIAESVEQDRSVVGRAVNGVAEMIGVTQRQPKRGRPRRKTGRSVKVGQSRRLY